MNVFNIFALGRKPNGICRATVSRTALAAGCGALARNIVKTLRYEPAASALPLTGRVGSRRLNSIGRTPLGQTEINLSLGFILLLTGFIFSLFFCSPSFAQLKTDAPQWPTVGTTTELVDVILPGPKLTGKPINDVDPVVVRVTDAIAHGDGFRYRIEYQGMEPGNFDLAKFLVLKNGEAATDLPSILVQIRSLLPPGQIQPNELTEGWLPRMGGYQILMVVLAVLWTLGLLGLIFLGRSRKVQQQDDTPPTTLAEMLKQRIQKACENEADSKDLAELERMLVAFWQKKLNLTDDAPHQALAKIRQHDESGPLMRKIESWIHQPPSSRADDQNVDWESLLAPYRNLPTASLEANSLKTNSLENNSLENNSPEASNALR